MRVRRYLVVLLEIGDKLLNFMRLGASEHLVIETVLRAVRFYFKHLPVREMVDVYVDICLNIVVDFVLSSNVNRGLLRLVIKVPEMLIVLIGYLVLKA